MDHCIVFYRDSGSPPSALPFHSPELEQARLYTAILEAIGCPGAQADRPPNMNLTTGFKPMNAGAYLKKANGDAHRPKMETHPSLQAYVSSLAYPCQFNC
jgi:hypothetical protein